MLIKFMLVTCLLTIMPGPSMVVILKNTIALGLGPGMQSILGVLTGDAILLLFIFTGIGAAIQASPTLLSIAQNTGALYLIYLGVKGLFTISNKMNDSDQLNKSAYAQGIGITLINPKIIIFLIAFFPQFMVSNESVIPQLLVMGPVFLIVVFITFSICAIGSHWIRKVLISEQGICWVNKICSFSLIGMGIIGITI